MDKLPDSKDAQRKQPAVAATDGNYTELSSDEIIGTISRLADRIQDRFPGSGLGKVCEQLLTIANQAKDRARWIAKPVYWLRYLTLLVSVAIISLVIVLPVHFANPDQKLGFFEFIQTMEAGINDIVLIGAAIIFLLSLEKRLKRKRALDAINELRSLAHIIDMHQLTKDPDRATSRKQFPTARSPKAEMSQYELRRYLDYCSEMLSLIGKVAALYVQEFDDAVALASATEVESLVTGLSRKIWQKILIVHTFDDSQNKPLNP